MASRVITHWVSRLIILVSLLVAFTGCDGATGPGSRPDPRIKWTVTLAPGIYYGSPALSRDEQTLYLGTSSPVLGIPATNYALYALSASTGATLWKYPLGASAVRSSPAVGPDGSITFVAGGTLFRLSSAGALLWTYDIRPTAISTVDVGQSTAAVADDGTTFVALGGLFAINADGSLRWRRFETTSEEMRSAPVIGADGTVYFAAHNLPLTALDPADGTTRWSLGLGVDDHVLASPAIGADGTVYVATNGCEVYAVSAQGMLRWSFAASSIGYTCSMRSSPAIDTDGTLYLGTTQADPTPIVLALNANGTVKWTFKPSGLPNDVPVSHFDIYSSPAIGSDGIVHLGQEFGRVYALAPGTGEVAWMVETRSGITWSSPALSAAGRLFISDLAGNVYSIETSSAGLKASSPWPKFRKDNQNGG